MSRIAGLEAVTAAPVLFFTVHDAKSGNARSNAVLAALSQRLGRHARCLSFGDELSLANHLQESRIPICGAVRLHDATRSKGFLSYTYHLRCDGKISYPSALFSAGIHVPVDNPKRAEIVARQIAADFERHFMKRINLEQFPWGSPRKSKGSLHPMTTPRSYFPLPAPGRERRRREPMFDDMRLTQLGC